MPLEFILKMQDWINTCNSINAMEHNKIKDKNDMIIPFMQNKHLEKYNSLSDKTLNKIGIGVNFPINLIKGSYLKKNNKN